MELNDVVSVISNVGFPIAMCLIVMYYMSSKFDATISKLQESFSQLNKVVQDNTTIIKQLLILMEHNDGTD